jgi:hypothetical protein
MVTNTLEIQFKRRKDLFFHSIRCCIPWWLCSIAVGCGEAEHHGEEGVREQNCLSYDSPEAEREQEGQGIRQSFSGHTPVTYFLQLGPSPNFHHLPLMPSLYESINGLIHDEVRAPMVQSLSRFPTSDVLEIKPHLCELFGGHIQPCVTTCRGPIVYYKKTGVTKKHLFSRPLVFV